MEQLVIVELIHFHLSDSPMKMDRSIFGACGVTDHVWVKIAANKSLFLEGHVVAATKCVFNRLGYHNPL